MSLSSDPSVTYNSAGNAVSSASLGAGASTTFVADFSSNMLGGWVQIWDTGGASVATTNGLQVQVFPAGDNTPGYDTVAIAQFTITTVASTVEKQSIPLPMGKYQFKLTNLDASNGITIEATTNPIA